MKNDRFKEVNDLLNKLVIVNLDKSADHKEKVDELIGNIRGVIKNNEKKIENELKQTKNQFENLFNYSPDAIFIHDFKEIIDVNKEFLSKFGYKDKNEIVGNSPMEGVVHADDYWIVKEGRNKLVNENTVHYPLLRFLKQNREVFFAEFFASVININNKRSYTQHPL